MKISVLFLFFSCSTFAQISPCDEEFKNYWHFWTSCQRGAVTIIDKPASVYFDSIANKIMVIPATFKALPKPKCTCFDGCNKKTVLETNGASIYPNPATDFLRISIPNNNVLSVQIMDLNGKIILETRVENEKILDITHIPNGIYFMVFSGNDLQYRNKIIVQH
jgi:hypothetical protein